MLMTKKKTDIQVFTVYDGNLDATDVFVDLIARKHRIVKYQDRCDKSSGNGLQNQLAIVKGTIYNGDEVQQAEAPFGLCG